MPDSEVFLRDDGLFTPDVGEGDELVDVTLDNMQSWRSAYLGAALGMGTVRGGGGGVSGIPPDTNHGTQLILRAMSLIPYGQETVEFALILQELVHGPHGEDPMLENLRRIHELLAQIQDDVLATWVTAREDNLAGVLAQSTAALKVANDFLKTRADRNDPVWAAKIALADTNSLIAVNTFAGDIDRGYWRRPFSIKAISQSGDPTGFYRGWMPHLPDRAEVDGLNRVWDPRWALPALLTTITVRLLVLTAFSDGTKGHDSLLREEAKQYIDVLNRVFVRRWQGLRCLKGLTPGQRDHFATYGRFPMVAVDIHGGDYIGGCFYPSQLTPANFAPGVAPATFLGFSSGHPIDPTWCDHNVKRFGEHWWNLLYVRTGIEDLFLYISQLWAIYEAPWFSKRITELSSELRGIFTDTAKASKAALASGLAASVSALDPSARTALTTTLYEAMDRDGERADDVVRDCVRRLERLL